MTQDSKFVQACHRLTDLVIINVLHVICCIPIFTIGAAMSALYWTTLRMAKDEETTPIYRDYLKAFRGNFRQATVLWLGMVLYALALFLDFRIATVIADDVSRSLFFGVLVVAGIVYLCLATYLFPLVAWFENTKRQQVKNALILSVSRLQYTLPLVILNLTPLLAVFVLGDYLKWIFALYFFIWFSAIAFLNGRILRHVFDGITPPEA